ncbi:hypothetical protein U8527_12155 [Kordia algicida OT-1]|uniref:Uncharacterized protein n=1 Tax=Kordia algicida OT-1 TaxID=391587 RepID=A9E0J5_9FLAO|nr:hypothetical protein [Kordia algicida]EDP95874.1 hypothetical protein KAOT1_05702 [Kordia algicida OT-1]
MKKLNRISLKLNKKSISNLNQQTVKGGGITLGGDACPILPPINNPAPDPIPNPDDDGPVTLSDFDLC